MPQVQVIQPIQQQPKRLRVAAYARVSSDSSNIHSIESSRLSHEINTLLASPEPDAESIVRKILHRAELQFTCCSAGDADPATLQIKRACNELEPTDTFPLKLYAEIVSNVILYRDTHIEIKLRNGQIL